MKSDFKGRIEEIKNEQMNPEETKKYILAIKKVIRPVYENCKDEMSKEQIVSEFLEEYEKDLQFRGNARAIYFDMSKYDIYKRIIQESKANKQSFNGIVKEAKKMEDTQKRTVISNLQSEYKQEMVSAVRNIIRTKGATKDKDILSAIEEEKGKLEKNIRTQMVHIIHSSVCMLEEYGFLDEYIESSNDDLEKLGLSELKYLKRNPIPDEQYDSEGNLVKDVEDIGVIDALSEEELEKVPVEELLLMTAFYESKYFQERLGISNAMSVIKTLNMWNEILHGDDKYIKEFDNEKIEGALKKDLAINYLCNDNLEITNKMKKQYRKFLKTQGLEDSKEIEYEVKETTMEMNNLQSAGVDISILEGLIMQQLKSKSIKMKKWGVLEVDENDVAIALESKKFRGPLIMGVPKNIIKKYCGTDENSFPKYDKKIDETYSNIMAKLYLPTNTFFKKTLKKAYQENPESKSIANIAGYDSLEER